ncbi:nucleoside/nucleotide kinase family protein [Demequina sp. SYSU T00039]|uniref:Nucleoside/nucleotide kinase family protein n=1 Tax=Demequina lignilytica TaxID=3051663 RepID=A0AAW7M1C5_9MICO|nr:MULTISPECIES: nucleoside/nucleotide kinase family protein [unclassified Demequina]MDN4478339.1 nucleoside/nucleotide kinase family protein [Demequina sp. SYSU T00039-1]MDN4487154.1 nucleoside/nucleotide kinase family protein [Demequina sp. SYSU T00039]
MIKMLAERARALAAGGGRVVIGIAGIPGSGKSTAATALVRRLGAYGTPAAYLPMDGFHLSASTLAAQGLADRKGAPDTFDVDGYVALLRQVRSGLGMAQWAPDYDRESHDVVPARMLIHPDARVVITEGNYLALPEGPWAAVRPLLAELWGIEASWEGARERLIERRVTTGRTLDEAVAWVDRVDAANAALVAPTIDLADVVVAFDEMHPESV